MMRKESHVLPGLYACSVIVTLACNVQSAIIWNLGRGVCVVIRMVEREQERERQVRVRYNAMRYDTIRNGAYL